jgi:hypothetical protein
MFFESFILGPFLAVASNSIQNESLCQQMDGLESCQRICDDSGYRTLERNVQMTDETTESTGSSMKQRAKQEVKGFIKDDLIGASDWNRSKIGAITGIPIAFRAAASMHKSMTDSSRHLGILMNGLTATESLPELGEEYDDSDERARFEASMALHGRTARDIEISVRNTFYTTYLYMTLSLANVIISTMTMIGNPPGDIVAFIMRLGPLPLLLALFLKHSYTNWMLRNRILGSFRSFVTSRRYLPSK